MCVFDDVLVVVREEREEQGVVSRSKREWKRIFFLYHQIPLLEEFVFFVVVEKVVAAR